ncbi:hypothetical protein ACSQ67_016714 [Phaseolus vulgaris]
MPRKSERIGKRQSSPDPSRTLEEGSREEWWSNCSRGRNGVVAFFAFCTWQPWPNASASAPEDTDAMPTVDASDGKHHLVIVDVVRGDVGLAGVDEVWVGLPVNVAFAELAAARPNFGPLINYCSEDWGVRRGRVKRAKIDLVSNSWNARYVQVGLMSKRVGSRTTQAFMHPALASSNRKLKSVAENIYKVLCMAHYQRVRVDVGTYMRDSLQSALFLSSSLLKKMLQHNCL